MYARQKGWNLAQVTVEIDYDHHATPRTADLAIHITGDLTAEQLRRLEKVAAACPVHRSLCMGVEVSSEITAQEHSDLFVPDKQTRPASSRDLLIRH
jgi:putative redox protein